MKNFKLSILFVSVMLMICSCGNKKTAEEPALNPNMQYRELGSTGIKVAEIGIGCSAFGYMDTAQSYEFMTVALEGGVNYMDLYDADPTVRSNIGYALRGRRDQMNIQGHIGNYWNNGQYERTRDMDKVKAGFEDLLQRLETDHIEVGMLHISDDMEDWNAIANGPMIEYAKQLKAEGKIKHIGMSSHNAEVALAAAKSGLVEVIMFSLNPAFDLIPSGLSVWDSTSYTQMMSGIDPVRVELYDYCAQHNIAITVMKAFGGAGGQLMDASRSPLKAALSPAQCLAYALAKPCVATVVCGAKTINELKIDLAYEQASESDKDYSAVLNGEGQHSGESACTYCNHCSPCPQGIDIAKVNELLDQATAGDQVPENVAKEYKALAHKAGECTQCGACESRCPFGVSIRERMKEAQRVFGE